MNAMPSLNGSVGYIFTSCDLDVHSSADVRFKDMIERFRVYDQPKRPEDKGEEWLAGERVDTRGLYYSLNTPLKPMLIVKQIISCMVVSTSLQADWMLSIRPGYLQLFKGLSLPSQILPHYLLPGLMSAT